MADSLDIEESVEADFAELIDDGSIISFPVHRKLANLGEAPDYSGGRISVGAEIRGSSLEGGQGPTGFHVVDVEICAETHQAEDAAGDDLRALAKAIRNILHFDDLPAQLTAASSVATYYNVQFGNTLRDDDGRIQRLAMNYSIVMRPSN